MGKEVPLAPADSDFDRAAEWRLFVVADALDGLSNLYLRIEYVGDVGRLYAGGQLLDDNFYNGTAWEIELKRFAPKALGRELDLKILPLRKNAPIYLATDAWPSFPSNGEIAEIRNISVSPEYHVTVSMA
jgi:hypothetical protein